MSWEIREGDCLPELAKLPSKSIQTCITSPPYWGLRDYGTAKWEGGDAECDHEAARVAIGNTPSAKSTLTTNNGKGPKAGDKFAAGSQSGYAAECPCGAKRIDSQLGLEPTPEEYVANLVAVFREVRRVLRDDGTVWLNLGDSYAGGGGFSPSAPSTATSKSGRHGSIGGLKQGGVPVVGGLKAKDLVGIPWRVAFALQADGWYLRSDVIWAKPNPMPESVTDRPTRSHEYVFLLTKSPRYFYDADAIREGAVSTSGSGNGYARPERKSYENSDGSARGSSEPWNDVGGSRNRRSVWTVSTRAFPGAHFATFPPKLIEPCVLAGAPKGATVLDPFNGAGTTGLVANRHGRDYIGIELNPEYAEMARERIRRDEANPNGHLSSNVEQMDGQASLLDM